MISKTAGMLFVSTAIAASLFAMQGQEPEPDTGIHPAMREDEDTIVFFNPPRVLDPPVTFLSGPPTIDGILDGDLKDLSVRAFSRLGKSTPENPLIPCHYRLAYGTDFFYVYVEAEGDELTYRDRAYQNGDGFAMVLCLPTPDDEPTEDFYVLACSAVKDPGLEWTRRVFWYYNVDTIFLPASGDTKLQFTAKNGKISFELLLPWKDVHPYHPWISDGIGFNLMFTKAVGESETNWYRVIRGTVGAENMPRWYVRLAFDDPMVGEQPETFVSTCRGNTEEGKSANALAVTCASREVMEEIEVVVEEKGGAVTRETLADYVCDPGITHYKFEVLPADLQHGDYVFKWESKRGSGRGELEVTVLPRFDRASIDQKMAEAKGRISSGSYATLEYKIQRLEGLLEDLPAYEVASYERGVFERVGEQLEQAAEGNDPYAAQTRPLRRAFRSKLDNTLQPYVVRVPQGYDTDKMYPLLVFLHGSASTETDILGFPFLSPGDMIEIGPFGRGRSNGFATPEAQIDIAEAIDDVIANYRVEESSVILTGFSMGGYGAYRTFFETPKKFKAVAIFSGGPELGRAYAPNSDIPSFLDDESLKPFAGIPIFIYHGEQDRNVSFARTLEVVERLKAADAEVVFQSDPRRGHEAPPDAVIQAYHQWVRNVLSR